MQPITLIKVKKPTKELVSFLYKNFSFSSESMLSEYAKLFINSSNHNRLHFNVVVAFCGVRAVGWAIATTNLARHRKFYNYSDIFKKKSLLMMLYVDKRYRGLGIASGLFKELFKMNPGKHFIVIVHDKISLKFFDKFKRIHKKRITIIDWR